MSDKIKNVILNNITYGFVRDFRHNKDIRTRFNNLTEVSFGFNFEEWYLGGYWGEKYIPYSLLHDNKVISNVSVNIIEFFIEEEKKIGIQIGTVMTDKEYQNRGLNKFIMDQVLEEWREKSDFIYLFANDSVLNFYPRFNFEKVNEYRYSKTVNSNSDISLLKKLNIQDAKEKMFLIETIEMSIPISKVSMCDNMSLIMFYCTSIKKNNIYYIDELKAIVIADYKDDTLYLNDVFSKGYVNLNGVIQVMSSKGI